MTFHTHSAGYDHVNCLQLKCTWLANAVLPILSLSFLTLTENQNDTVCYWECSDV